MLFIGKSDVIGLRCWKFFYCHRHVPGQSAYVPGRSAARCPAMGMQTGVKLAYGSYLFISLLGLLFQGRDESEL